jgi:hypothetical protein
MHIFVHGNKNKHDVLLLQEANLASSHHTWLPIKKSTIIFAHVYSIAMFEYQYSETAWGCLAIGTSKNNMVEHQTFPKKIKKMRQAQISTGIVPFFVHGSSPC